MTARKRLKELTIKDNFMFGAVMCDESNWLLFRRTPITPLIGVKRTSKASQSGFISPKATWNMKPPVTIRMSAG